MKKCKAERCQLFENTKKLFKRSASSKSETSAAHMQEADTQKRLLAEATRLFAEKGNAASVREICHAANANASAINYHFGNKDELLAQVLADRLQQSLERFPIHGGIPEDAPAKERLYGFIRGFLCRLMLCDEKQQAESKLRELLSEGFFTPTPAFAPYADAHRQIHKAFLTPILRELAGDNVSGISLVMIARSIVSQALFYSTHLSGLITLRTGETFSEQEIDAIARHITTFSIGGIQSYEPHQSLEHIHLLFEGVPDTD